MSDSPTPWYRYFTWAIVVTVVGLLASVALGWQSTGTWPGTLTVFFICSVLAVLEISFSFDNAIVNAKTLKTMTPQWQKRFLTWGILIAVFGMRIVFPLLIVVVAASMGPIEALRFAIVEPEQYARMMTDAHLPIVAFGGTFLLMVGLSYFFDHEKDVHWVEWIEKHLARFASVKGIEIAFALGLVMLISRFLPTDDAATFISAAVYGLLTYLIVEIVGAFLDQSRDGTNAAARGGLGAFLYLEVLDASFSFDGVVGAFALSQNLFVIAIGLGIGAMYVRSLTIMLVERGTLSSYRFLEHGAFYAILVLSVVMYLQTLIHIPEAFTGLVGAALVGLGLWSSIRWNRNALRRQPSSSTTSTKSAD